MALNKRQNRRSNDITLSLLLFFFFNHETPLKLKRDTLWLLQTPLVQHLILWQ